jgi:peptidyl-prolyl cis-trans isomerase SurA
MKQWKIKVLFLAMLTLPMTMVCLGQYEDDDRILLTIEEEQVPVSEFMYVYNKNNINNEVIDQKSLEEYLELYINFKLKVREAKELGMDTAAAFVKELNGYRQQLAEPYFIDEEVNEELMRTAYERSKYDIRASHILIKVDQYAPPKDTLEAYNRIMEIRERILEGEDFGEVAAEVSEDPTAADRPGSNGRRPRKGNKGDLGYFSVFDMIYPFEEAAYNSEIGEISMPVRTSYGYHIILVADKQEALGRAKVAHIYLSFPPNPSSEDSIQRREKIYMIYDKLQAGEAFEDLVKEYSDDKGSVDKGGVLPWFGSNRMVPSFIDAVKKLEEPGDYSEPVLTDFGWHIIMLKERKTPGTYEEEIEGIKRNMVKDMRYQKGKQSVINRIKKEYGFKEYPEALEEIQASLDSTFVAGKWSIENISGMAKPLFELGDITRTQQDFGSYLEKNQGRRGVKPVPDFFREQYKIYVDDQCIAYEDKRLEEKYPEFRILMEEYRDGILLFNLTDEKVWTKAIKDTVGLEAYHQSHEMDYMWGERLDVSVCIVNDMAILDQARKLMKKGADKDVVLEKFNSDTLQVVFVEDRLYSRKENDLIDSLAWKKGLTDNYSIKEHPEFRFNNDVSRDALFFLRINGIIPPAPKTLEEARGLITSDYQNYLEQKWIEELRQKYTVVVNREVLTSIK